MILQKYSASGNDFLIFHTLKNDNYSKLAKELCHRHLGIGADGLVVLLPHDIYAYKWDFYNADGSCADMCGNASRCVAHYALQNGIARQSHSFLSGAGEICVNVNGDIVEVKFGEIKILQERLKYSGLEFSLIDSGVPHIVYFCHKHSELSTTLQSTHTKKLMAELRYKYNANVNFAYIKSKNEIFTSTFERGVEDITLACGSGMASIFYKANKDNLINDEVVITPPSGDSVKFRIENNSVYFSGVVKKIATIVI